MTLKEKLIKRKLSIGSWVTISHSSVVEIMADAGFEWLVLDLEHSPMSIEKALNLISIIQGKGLKALVRVGQNDPLIIKRVMDCGADGIIVPMICSQSEAEDVVKNTNYPPIGNRGVGLSRAQGYGHNFQEYKEWLKDESVIIVQIEHKNGVDNIEDILSVNGINGVLIGPYDLSASYGYPGDFKNKLVLNAVKKIETACKNKRISLGFHVIQPNHFEVLEKIKLGYNFIAFSIDFLFLGTKSKQEMVRINNEI